MPAAFAGVADVGGGGGKAAAELVLPSCLPPLPRTPAFALLAGGACSRGVWPLLQVIGVLSGADSRQTLAACGAHTICESITHLPLA